MNDITLVCVNWNQQPCVELLLKSYVKRHFIGSKLKLLLVDNGSKDGSKEWLNLMGVPFVDFNNNHGHENALNMIYGDIKTKYVMLVDTDVEFLGNVFSYVMEMKDGCISVGELIDKNYMNDIKIKDRISPWFWMFDYEAMREIGVDTFRTKEDWTYDVGSEYWEKMVSAGYTNYNLIRKSGNQDNDLVSMQYDKVSHFGKVSWDIETKHGDRKTEVERRRHYIRERLELYKDVDLTNKFRA